MTRKTDLPDRLIFELATCLAVREQARLKKAQLQIVKYTKTWSKTQKDSFRFCVYTFEKRLVVVNADMIFVRKNPQRQVYRQKSHAKKYVIHDSYINYAKFFVVF